MALGQMGIAFYKMLKSTQIKMHNIFDARYEVAMKHNMRILIDT